MSQVRVYDTAGNKDSLSPLGALIGLLGNELRFKKRSTKDARMLGKGCRLPSSNKLQPISSRSQSQRNLGS